MVLYYALLFLIGGQVAGVLGLSGIGGVASPIAWILFVIGAVLMAIHFVTGRSPTV